MFSRINESNRIAIATLVILAIFLVGACGPILPGQGAQETVTSAPTFTPVLPTAMQTMTLEAIPATVTPSPMPTQAIIPFITADSMQVERWREYQDALAVALFPPNIIPQSPDEFLCEWEILGQSNEAIYVWAVCMSTFSATSNGILYHAGLPAVIHIHADGAVQSVEIPGGGGDYVRDIRRMFPLDAQERYFGGSIHFQELTDHLRWRREHLEEPPLIVLSATPAP